MTETKEQLKRELISLFPEDMTPNEPHQNCMLEYIISKKAELQNKMDKMDDLNFYQRKILNWVPGAQEKVETLKSILQQIQDSDDGQSLSDLDSSDNERSDTKSVESGESRRNESNYLTPEEQIEFLKDNYVDIYKLVDSISNKIKDFARQGTASDAEEQWGEIILGMLVSEIFEKYNLIPTSIKDDTLTPAEITIRNQYITEVNRILQPILQRKQQEIEEAMFWNQNAVFWSQQVINALADLDVKPEIERFKLKQDYQQLQKSHKARMAENQARMTEVETRMAKVGEVAARGKGKNTREITRLLQNTTNGGGTKKINRRKTKKKRASWKIAQDKFKKKSLRTNCGKRGGKYPTKKTCPKECDFIDMGSGGTYCNPKKNTKRSKKAKKPRKTKRR